MSSRLPAGWAAALHDQVTGPAWDQLQEYVADERREHPVYPAPEDVYAAFALTALEDVRVLILGQDPYYNPKEAMGLSFSVRDDVPRPASLLVILGELKADLGVEGPSDLSGWARQGVLMLNTVLTVRGGYPGSHRGHGWEVVTDEAIRRVSDQTEPVVFVLWGADARRRKRLVDRERHTVIEGAHPAARAGARDRIPGSKPFSRINQAVRGPAIDWAR